MARLITPKTPRPFKAYKYRELRPAVRDAVFARWQERQDACGEIPWADEIMDSLKAVFAAAGAPLRDWSIGPESYRNEARYTLPDGIADLRGPRALAWLENRILGPLRAPYGLPKELKPGAPLPKGYTRGQRLADGAVTGDDSNPITRWTRPGAVPSCPFTGYCADEDFLDCLRKALAAGDTVEEALNGLPSEASRMMQEEIDYHRSREWFKESAAHDCEYKYNGEEV